MKEFDLKEMFTTTCKETKVPIPHELKQFFADRLIPSAKIAEVLNDNSKGEPITKGYVSYWLSGIKPIPKKRETELYELQQKFLDWESEHGHMFNSQATIAQNEEVEELPLCPYDSDGAKFGYHFDFYDECAECDLFEECKLWTESHPKEYEQSKKENGMI